MRIPALITMAGGVACGAMAGWGMFTDAGRRATSTRWRASSRSDLVYPRAPADVVGCEVMRLRDVALLTLMAIGTIVFLPVIIPIAMIDASVRGQRMRRAAETFGCVVCGMVLTAQAVEWADQECQREAEEMRRKFPRHIYRMRERTCHAICPGCGTRYTYLERERTFELEKARSAPVRRVLSAEFRMLRSDVAGSWLPASRFSLLPEHSASCAIFLDPSKFVPRKASFG